MKTEYGKTEYEKTNYHTHTARCRHAQGTEEDYVSAAVRNGLRILGFSDHAPFPDHDFGLRMPYSELEEYLRAIDALTAKYSADIILYKGLEIEYLPEYMEYYDRLLTKSGMDYLLLGEHFYRDRNGCLCNITQADKTETYVDYALAVAEAMRTGFFQAVAHPDIFAMSRFAWDSNCDRAADIIISAALETDTVLEYNANGLRRGIHSYPDGDRFMYPHALFWSKAADAGIRVMIGSDCHNPSQIWDAAMEEAYIRVREIGLQPVLTMP